MHADRRINAPAPTILGAQQFVQRLAHPQQALELVACTGRRHGVDRAHGVRIVGGELRVDMRGIGEQALGAAQIREIGAGLARQHRIAGQAQDLCALDLAVPVGAFDEAHGDAPVESMAQSVQPIDGRRCSLGVGLHGDAEAAPSGQVGRLQYGLNDRQRQVQALSFLGIEVEADVAGTRVHRERVYARYQFRHHASVRELFIAGMQRRQFD